MGFSEWLRAVLKRLTNEAVLMTVLLVLTAVGLWAVAKSLPGGSISALGMVWCLSCLTVGLLGGFLFAIPRVSAARHRLGDEGKKNGQEHPDISGLGINTNLEEISDWLTKILVGIGLVEAKTLTSYLRSAGQYIGGSLGPNGKVVAVGLVIFFLCIGFLSGFLATRLFVSPSLRRADAETAGMNETERLAQEAKDQSDATPELYDVLDAAYATYVDFKKKQPIDQTGAKGAEASAGTVAAKATPKSILPPELAYSYLHEFNKFYDQKRWQLNRRLHILMANFYADTGSFSDSIRVMTRFIEKKREAEQFDIHLAAALYNRACYRSRIASTTTDKEQKEKQMSLALQDLAEDIRICPSDAEEAKQDPDLAQWQNDPRFCKIINAQ